jgi:hypothetical protein
MKLEFSWQIFEKYSDINFHGNVLSGSQVIPCGQTDRQMDGRPDRHGDANSHFT